jgi:hypothetical protein
MSRGAVDQYGVDTLEAMNAAAGGTNRPKIVSGIPHAYGGGLIGKDHGEGGIRSGSNTPFIKDPFGAINRFLNYKFGVDIGKKSTWGFPMPGSSSRPKQVAASSVSSGSLMNDPIGAVARIANNMGIKTPNVPSSKPKSGSGNIFSKVMGAVQEKFTGKRGGSKPKGGERGFFENMKSSTYRDAGSIYARQMLGGYGGPVSEMDLSGQSQAELQKAIQRAKKRTAQQIRIEQSKLNDLLTNPPKPGQDKTEWNNAVATQRSFLKKFKDGGIRVQYADYSENGKMSESAKNSKNILGQFWAYGRNKKEGGGYRIEDKYDFDKMKDPMSVLFGKGKSTQQRLQALHQMNPLRGKGDVDMILGGKRTTSESLGLSASKTLLGGMFGISGNPKATKAKIAQTKPKNTRGIKPPTSSRPRVVYGPPIPQKRNVRGGRSTQSTPRFSPTTKGMRSKQETLGLMR